MSMTRRVLSRRGAIAAIISLAVIVRVIYLLSIASTPMLDFPQLFTESDMHMFDEWAKTILNGDILSAHHTHIYQWQLDAAPAEQWNHWYGDAPTFHKAPFYAYLLAFLRWTFSEPAIPLALLQIAAAGVSAFFLFRIAESLFGGIAATATAALFALYGPSIQYDVVMLRRAWITLSMLAVTLALIHLRTRPAQAGAVVLGLTLGFGILVFEGFVLLPFFLLPLILWWFSFSVGLRLTGGILLGTALPLSLIVIRNFIVGAPLLKLAVAGSIVFSVSNAAGAHPQLLIVEPSFYLPILEKTDGRLLETIVASLQTFGSVGAAIHFYLQRALALGSSFEIPNNINYYYNALQSPLLALLPGYRLLFSTAIAGLVIAAWKRVDFSALLPCGLAALALVFASAPLSRYRISLAIMLLPLAGCFVQYTWNWLRMRRLAPLGISLLAAATLYATGYWIEATVFPGTWFRGPRYYRTTEFLTTTDFYLNRGMPEKAQAEIQRMVELTQQFEPEEVVTLAMHQARLGQLNAARRNLESARSVAQTDPPLLTRIGDIYWRSVGDPRTAWTVYQEALKADPKPSDRERLLKLVQILERRYQQ